MTNGLSEQGPLDLTNTVQRCIRSWSPKLKLQNNQNGYLQ